MSRKLHPLVQRTKIELARLDKFPNLSWEKQKKYRNEYLPISVEPKLRTRALRFMDSLIKLLEENHHIIKFEYNRCHIEMYGQLTEINLRQKYFRKRIKDSSGYSSDSFEKSNKLEFQIGSCYRKGWIDKVTKQLEDYLTAIYGYIEKDSKRLAELRKQQRLDEEKGENQRLLELERAELMARENDKLEKLIIDSENYLKASKIRSYLKALQEKINQTEGLNILLNQDYIEWASKKANDIDPLNDL
jgi:hypothetical protein